MTGENSKSSEFVLLKVVDQRSDEVHFRVNVNVELGKVKKSYSERVGADLGLLRFLFDGRQFADDKTAKQLDMKDNDVIEVYQLQNGGASTTQE